MDHLDELALWLADHADKPITNLHEDFCRELVARGVPLWRSSLGVELLHPEQSGSQSIWTTEAPATLRPAYHGIEASSDYLRSPAKIVDDTGQMFRCRLDIPQPDLPLLEELRLNGATDYVIWPLPFLERTRTAFVSFASDASGGFSDDDMNLLGPAARLFSPYAERRALRRVAVDLLDTYVGHHAGERIYSGQIIRGTLDTIEAAILMSDLRNFTVLEVQR